MKASHLVLLIVLNLGWAAVPTIATRLEEVLSPAQFVFLRYALALGAMALVAPWLPGCFPRGADFWRTVGMGAAVFCLGHFLQIAGIQRSTASDASVLIALDPLVSTIGAALFLKEHVPARRWLGLGLAIAGVTLMSLWQSDTPLPGLLANLLILLSFVTEAVWSVVGKPLITRWGIPRITLLALASGTVCNMLLLAVTPGDHAGAFARLGTEGWLSLAALGVVLTAFGYSAWHWVIRDVPVSLAALTVYLQPVLALAMAISFAGASLHAGHVMGSVVIVVGLVIGIRGRTPPVVAAEMPQK